MLAKLNNSLVFVAVISSYSPLTSNEIPFRNTNSSTVDLATSVLKPENMFVKLPNFNPVDDKCMLYPSPRLALEKSSNVVELMSHDQTRVFP